MLVLLLLSLCDTHTYERKSTRKRKTRTGREREENGQGREEKDEEIESLTTTTAVGRDSEANHYRRIISHRPALRKVGWGIEGREKGREFRQEKGRTALPHKGPSVCWRWAPSVQSITGQLLECPCCWGQNEAPDGHNGRQAPCTVTEL